MEFEKMSRKELEAIIEQGMAKQEVVLETDPITLFQVLRDTRPPIGLVCAGEPILSFDDGKITGNGRRLEIAMTKITVPEITMAENTGPTFRAIIFEAERLSDEQILVTGKYLQEARAHFDDLWQHMIKVFAASERVDPAKGREEKIHRLWLRGESDRNIGRIVGLSSDRVKQIRHANQWKKTRNQKTT